jgi:hypothetical protein
MKMQMQSQSEYIQLLEARYRQRGGVKTFPGLQSIYALHPAYKGCVQWQFTPSYVLDFDLFGVINLNTTTWAVLVNVEIIHYLLDKGVDCKNIFFYSDCQWKAAWASKVLDDSNITMLPNCNNKKEFKRYITMTEKKVDFVLNNVPFGMFKEFKELAQKLAKEKVLIIAGSRDYHNKEKAFENVEVYKYLGACFPTAKIVASLALVNPNGAKSFNVIDAHSNFNPVIRNHPIAPGTNAQDYIWALSVLDKKLPGYTKFATGNLYRKDAKFNPNGVKLAFTMGRANAPFDADNYGSSNLEIQSQKTAWSTVDPSQKSLLGGYGEHAIGISYMANETGHLGNVKYLAPDMGCGEKTYWHPVINETDASEAIKYLNHPAVVRLVAVLKSSVCSNGKETFSLIPHHSHATKWINNYV